MPLFQLDPIPMLIMICILSPFIQVTGALIGRTMPDRRLNFEAFVFRSHKCENNGKIYRLFLVHKWKGILPDGAKYFKGDFTKKHLLETSSEYLSKFIRESCRAEIVHYLGMIPFIVFFFLVPAYIAAILIGYAILVNAPCIIAQRYNRPRLINVYKITLLKEKRLKEKTEAQNAESQTSSK